MLPSRIIETRIEAGCDEVGRGCLAGPVVAAAVILPANFAHTKLNDSKKLNEKTRLALREIIEREALAWSVSFVEPVIIDRINILHASFLAMTRAVGRLGVMPEHLLIDGNRFYSQLDIPFSCIVKGDSKVGSIAAASILAKTYRDEYMKRIDLEFPIFGWNKNVGYPTSEHRNGIIEYGSTRFHRKSFRLLPAQLEMEF